MTAPALDRAQLAHAVGAFAAQAMKDAALLAKAAAWLADDTYPLSQAAGALKRMSGPEGVGIMLREQVEPFAESAKALSRTLPKNEQGVSKPRRKPERIAPRTLPKNEQGVSKPRRKPERIAPRRDDVAYLSDQLDQRRAQDREQERAFLAKVRALSPEQLEVFHQRMAEIEASLSQQECTVVPLRGLPRHLDGDAPRPVA